MVVSETLKHDQDGHDTTELSQEALMFIEKEWDKYWKRILLFIFVILTLPSIWLPELSDDEAFRPGAQRRHKRSRRNGAGIALDQYAGQGAGRQIGH